MLASPLLLLGLPAGDMTPGERVHKVLAPLVLQGGPPVTSRTTPGMKLALKSATTTLVSGDCQCWMWSDPHLETCNGKTADFNPMPEHVHSLAEGGGISLQSYHCPVVQSTCQPDYYPCGASAAVAFAGTFVDKAGASHTIVFAGERVIVDGEEVALGVWYDWAPKAVQIEHGCTLERKTNRVVDPKEKAPDAGKMAGDYETSFSCGKAKVTTWYYREEHMPTGYLMNALVEIPAADAPGVKGLCHGVTGDDAKPPDDNHFKGDGLDEIVEWLEKYCGDDPPPLTTMPPPTTTMPPKTTTMRPTTTMPPPTTTAKPTTTFKPTTTKPKKCYLADTEGKSCKSVCSAEGKKCRSGYGPSCSKGSDGKVVCSPKGQQQQGQKGQQQQGQKTQQQKQQDPLDALMAAECAELSSLEDLATNEGSTNKCTIHNNDPTKCVSSFITRTDGTYSLCLYNPDGKPADPTLAGEAPGPFWKDQLCYSSSDRSRARA